jgi:predicted ATPase
MLTSWRLCQFKSVTELTPLEIAPLTVFTGANSAGKSTIIQSMLLTAQTMQSPVYGRPVVLNGHMSRLGSFTDLVSGGDDDSEITIGFDLSAGTATKFGSRARPPKLYAYRRGSTIEQVSVQYSFTSRPGPNDGEGKDLLLLQPSLVESMAEVTFASEGRLQKESIHVKRAVDPVFDRLRSLQLGDAVLDPGDVEALRYQVIKEPRKSSRLEDPRLKGDAVGCNLMHFIPRSLALRYDEVAAEVSAQLATIVEPNSYRMLASRHAEKRVPGGAVEFIVELLRGTLAQNEELTGRHGLSSLGKRNVETALEGFQKTGDVGELQRLYRRLPGRDVSFLFTVLGAERATIEKLLRGSRSSKLALQTVYPGDHFQLGADFVHDYFLRSVKYLGPLRDEPKPVYPLAGSSDPADVGFKGEFTAAVLHVHKNTVVEYIPSGAFEESASEVDSKPVSLAAAVQDWLSYMGVGKGFETSDLGKLGHELKVITEGSSLKHDLTQVGVGVSQVLPILVLALLADAGSTLIFEQPELHLHPRVQSRLADFFVSMTKLGKQCIVETHSEYLINRLRYRAAADVGDEVARSTAVYFVTKNGERSDYSRIKLDELGGFDTWPSGFFDESEEATARLLRQSLRKRRAKREGAA